ncbi:hypothetical protein, partial [Acinetobacter baumannii]|uniref:hypothetical protein n=1 Tax=Acinetobacter baumannii TaxID=470 RepID=UPI0024B7FE06
GERRGGEEKGKGRRKKRKEERREGEERGGRKDEREVREEREGEEGKRGGINIQVEGGGGNQTIKKTTGKKRRGRGKKENPSNTNTMVQ